MHEHFQMMQDSQEKSKLRIHPIKRKHREAFRKWPGDDQCACFLNAAGDGSAAKCVHCWAPQPVAEAHPLGTPLGFCQMASHPRTSMWNSQLRVRRGKWRAEYATSYLKPRRHQIRPPGGLFSIIPKSHWEPNGLLYTGTKSSSRYYSNSSVKFGLFLKTSATNGTLFIKLLVCMWSINIFWWSLGSN